MSLFNKPTPAEKAIIERWAMKNSSPAYDQQAEDQYVEENRAKFEEHASELVRFVNGMSNT